VLGCPERVRVVLNSSSSRIWAQGPRAGEPLLSSRLGVWPTSVGREGTWRERFLQGLSISKQVRCSGSRLLQLGSCVRVCSVPHTHRPPNSFCA